MDEEEDFELQPLDGCDEDEDDVDAKNVDTFAEGGALGDDWQPDANALGAFEALRIATQQQGLQERGRRQQQSPPPFPFLQQKEQEADISRGSVYAAPPLPQHRQQQQQRLLEQEQQQQQFPLQHQDRLAWQQPLQQQQRQPAQSQLQPSQPLEHSLSQQQLRGRTTAAGAAEVAGGEQARGFLGSSFQSSSRSTVTEQLNRLIAFKRQQHQQQAPWLPSTGGPDVPTPRTTAVASSAGAGFTSAVPPAAVGPTAAAVAPGDARPSAAGAGFAAASSAGEGPAFRSNFDIGSVVERPPAGPRDFGLDSFTTPGAAVVPGAGSVCGDLFAAGTGSAAAASSSETALFPTATATGRAVATAAAGRGAPGADVFLTRRPPPGLQLPRQFVSSASALQQQQQQQLLNKHVNERQPPQLLAEQDTLAAVDAISSAAAAAALVLSPAAGPAGGLPVAPATYGAAAHSSSAPAAARTPTLPSPAPNAGRDTTLTEEDQRSMLQLLKNLNLTAAALAALDGADACGATETATARAPGMQQMQRQMQREHLLSPRQHDRAERLHPLQLQQELHQRYLQQQELQEQQRQQQQRQQQERRQQEQEFLQQEQVGHSRGQERLHRQQRLLQFLRPGGYARGGGEAAAEDVPLGEDGAAAAGARRPPEAAAGTVGAPHTCVREQIQQQDSQKPTGPAALRLPWEAVFPSGHPQLQQPQQLQEQRDYEVTRQQELAQEQPMRQPVAPLVFLQNSRATGDCAPAVVGTAAVPREPVGRMQQDQQQLQQQSVQGLQQSCSGASPSGSTSVVEGTRVEKKVFTEAEVLQMLAAASRRDSSERASAAVVQPKHFAALPMRQQRPPFQVLQRLQQQQQSSQHHHAQSQPKQEPHVFEQRQQAEQQQPQGQCERTEQQQHVQQLTQQQLPDLQNLQMQRQEQQAGAAWLSAGELPTQQLREGLYPSSLRGVTEEDRRRRQQQLQQPPLRPPVLQQQRPETTLPQQQEQPQQQQQQQSEAQQSGRCCPALGAARSSEESREGTAGGGGATAGGPGMRGNAARPVGGMVFPAATNAEGVPKAAASAAGKAASPASGKAAATARFQGPVPRPFTASSAVPVAGVPVPPPVACEAVAEMRSGAHLGTNKAVTEGGKAAVPGNANSSSSLAAAGDAGGDPGTAALTGGTSSRAASSLAAIRASGLFPLTKAHREMAVKQQLQELLPWRLPQHLTGCNSSTSSGMPTPNSLSRSSSGYKAVSTNSSEAEKTGDKMRKGGQQKLMTSFDLEYILRLQLTSMAKVPQLQLVSGRWNFRFLRSQSTASAGTSNSRALSPCRGESGATVYDQPLQRKPLLPSLPVEMEQHLLQLLARQDASIQQAPGRLQSSAATLQSGFETNDVVMTTPAGREANPPLLPAVLERKLHGGVGITVVDGSTRMHRLLLGSITLQEATSLMEPLLSRQSSSFSRRDENFAAEELARKSSGNNWLNSLVASPDAGGPIDLDIGLLEPLEEEITEEKDAPEMSEEQEQQRRQAAAKERELRRLQKRFGKQTYCSVRQPRSSIYVGGPATGFAAVEEDPGYDDDDAAESWDGMPCSRQTGAGSAAGYREAETVAGAYDGQQQQGLAGSEKRLIAAPADAVGGSSDEKARRKFLRSLVFEETSSGRAPTRGAAGEDLLALTVVEDAFDLLLQAAALEEKLLECPASHVTARGRLVEQRQHLQLQLFELLLLRRHVRPARVSDRAFLYLVDFHPPACTADVEEYVHLFEQHLQHQEKLREVLLVVEQRQQERPQHPLQLRDTERLQLEAVRLQQEVAQLRTILAVDVVEGRCCSRWMLSRVYSIYKGRHLLLRSLLLLPDPQAAALVQGLCSSPSILYSVCVAADAALVPAEQLQVHQHQRTAANTSAAPETAEAFAAVRPGTEAAVGSSAVAAGIAFQAQNVGTEGQKQRRPPGDRGEEELEARARRLTVASAALLEELVLLLEVEVEGSREHMNRKRPLLQRLRDLKKGEPFGAAAEMYVQLTQLLLRLGSTSDACSTHFITGVAQHIVWGFSVEDVVKVLEWRSGCCFFSSLIALLPPPATLTPLQHEALQDCLKLVVSALLMTAATREALFATPVEGPKRQNRHVVLAPLIQTIVQQARPYECRAKIITTTAVALLGVEGAQEALSAFLQGNCL